MPIAPAAIAVLAAATLGGCGGSGGATTTVTVPTRTTPPDASTRQPGPVADLQTAFERVIAQVSPSVVQIETGQGLGSGVVFDTRGDIVTNAHVVGTAKRFTVTLAGGDQHQATLVGTDRLDDLAVVRLGSGSPPAATFGDSTRLAVGQLTLAMGNPLGLRSSVTQGIVSSLGRTVSEGNGTVITAAIQTSAPINPGNSGGALVGLEGKVIGIPTLVAADSQLGGPAPGIGFAIPSSVVRRIAPQLIASGHVTNSGHAFLGVSLATRIGQPGVLVASVIKGGPAASAGVRQGDLITGLNGKHVQSADDLATILAGLKPRQTVTLAITHSDGSNATVHVRLGQSPG